MCRRIIPFFHVSHEASQAQPVKCDVNESLGGFRGKASSPVRLGEIVSEVCFTLFVAGTEPTTSYVFPFFFKNCGPQAISFFWPAQVFIPETSARFFERPCSASHVTPDFGVCMHADKIGLILRLVRAKEQSLCFHENHSARLADRTWTIARVTPGRDPGSFHGVRTGR